MNARWNRLDIVHAWLQLESDYNVGGWLRERPSNVRRREACSVQAHRMGYSLLLPGRLNANARAIYRKAEARLFPRERPRHVACKVGAAVRLHGYCAARVVGIEREYTYGATRPTVYAHCIVTARHRVGPHGYRPGDAVTVHACYAVPRDLIRVKRGSGRLYWPRFTVQS